MSAELERRSAAPKDDRLRAQLYDACAKRPSGTLFHQEDLVGLGITSDLNKLLEICQALVNAQLFQILQDGGALCYRVRPREIAEKLRGMSGDQRMVYGYIEQTTTSGIWIKTIKAKSNLHDAPLKKCLKELEKKECIKEIKSAKFPTRKMYMLSHLEPSEENTGGAFFTDGEMDVGLIEGLSEVIVRYVAGQSWIEQKGTAKKDLKRKREADGEASNSADTAQEPDPPRYKPMLRRGHVLVPHRPDYTGYPTAENILEDIKARGIINDSLKLNEEDIRALCDTLVFDGRLERMYAGGFRTVRRPPDEGDNGPGNGLSQAPCGQCPVFDICEEGSPVSASNCIYFEEWLKF